MQWTTKYTDKSSVIGKGGVIRYWKCDPSPDDYDVTDPHAGITQIRTARISTEKGPYGSMKACNHEVVHNSITPINLIRRGTNVDYSIEYDEWPFGTPTPYSLSSKMPSDAELRSLNAQAFDGMSPSLEGELSLTNFILEIWDIKQLLDLVSKWEGFAKKLAAGHLSWQFGVKPLISDIKRIYDSLVNWQNYITAFLAERKHPQVRHFEIVHFEEEDQYAEAWTPYWRRTYDYKCKVVYHATMRYSYDCPDIVTWVDKLQALRDILGLRFGPSVVWEAIPYSFAVDWFIRVGDWLQQFEEPVWPVTVTVDDFCESIKGELSVTNAQMEVITGNCLPGSETQSMGDVYHKSYRRRRVAPNSGTFFINQGQYGLNQLALSGSLITMRLR